MGRKGNRKKADPEKKMEEQKRKHHHQQEESQRIGWQREIAAGDCDSLLIFSPSQAQIKVSPNITIPSGSALVMSRYCCVVAIVSSPGVALAFHHPAPFRIACDGSMSAPELSREHESPPVTDYYRTMGRRYPSNQRKI